MQGLQRMKKKQLCVPPDLHLKESFQVYLRNTLSMPCFTSHHCILEKILIFMHPRASSEVSKWTCYSPRYYVEEEQGELMTHMRTCVKDESEVGWKPSESSNVLQSSNRLFLRIQQSMQRCARYISCGEPFFLLSQAFQVNSLSQWSMGLYTSMNSTLAGSCVFLLACKWWTYWDWGQRILTGYGNELLKRLPKTASGQTTFSGPLIGTEWQIKMSASEELVVCSILHTAAYCASTSMTMERAIQRDIQPSYADQVPFHYNCLLLLLVEWISEELRCWAHLVAVMQTWCLLDQLLLR